MKDFISQTKVTIGTLLRISRPRYWVYLLAPYVLGIIAGISEATIFTSTTVWFICIFTIYFLFPANLLLYGINDIYDTDTDSLNPKKHGYEIILRDDDQPILVRTIFFVTVCFSVVSLFTPHTALSAFIIFIYTSIFYAAWPIRAKTRPFLDTFMSSVIYMAPGFFGYYLTGGVHISIFVVLAGFLWGVLMHMHRAVIDIGPDTEARVRTIATVLGRKTTHYILFFSYGILAVLSYAYIGILGPITAMLYIFLVFFSYRMKTYEKQFAVYMYIPQLTSVALFCMIVFFAIQKFTH